LISNVNRKTSENSEISISNEIGIALKCNPTRHLGEVIMIAEWDDFKTLKWIKEISYPELILKQVNDILKIAS